jgi:hypothetical protein
VGWTGVLAACLLLVVTPVVVLAQVPAPDSALPPGGPLLAEASASFLGLQRGAMLTLGGWAVGNLVAGPVLAARTTGAAREFWIMNAGWNVVNLAIAGWALSAGRPDPEAWQSLADVELARGQFRRLLWINAGLDVGYVATGAWLARRGDRLGSDRQSGFGRAVVVQGLFLLVFDTTVALLAR